MWCFRLLIAPAAIIAPIGFAVLDARAQEPPPEQTASGASWCKSKDPAPGARKTCELRAGFAFSAPAGSFLDSSRLITVDSRLVHWSQKSCRVVLSGYKEVLPGTGITMPTTVEAYATGRSNGKQHRMDYVCAVYVTYGTYSTLKRWQR
jgi:hypothetical protein